MAQGYSKVRFVGGVRNGQYNDKVGCGGLGDKIGVFSGKYYRNENDRISLVKSDSLDPFWVLYEVHNYRKDHKDQNGYLVYRFVDKSVVNRCKAITKQGHRCKHPAITGLEVCSTHKPNSA